MYQLSSPMALLVVDHESSLQKGTVHLPTFGNLSVGQPISGISIHALKAELSSTYGARFSVISLSEKRQHQPSNKPTRRSFRKFER